MKALFYCQGVSSINSASEINHDGNFAPIKKVKYSNVKEKKKLEGKYDLMHHKV